MKYISSDKNYEFGDLNIFVKSLVGVKVEREGTTYRFYDKNGYSRKIRQVSSYSSFEKLKFDIHVAEEIYKPLFNDFGYERIDWEEFKNWVIENC